jgi:hypothetical protein
MVHAEYPARTATHVARLMGNDATLTWFASLD